MRARHNGRRSRGVKPMSKPISKSFQARLERLNSPLKWVIVRVPFDARRLWGTRGRLKVRGEMNGFAFRTSLFPSREGGHLILVNKRMQAGAKAAPGVVAQFRLEPDMEARRVEKAIQDAVELAGKDKR